MPLSAGSWHSLIVDREGQIFSCGVERATGPDRRGLLGHGVLDNLRFGIFVPRPIAQLSGIKIRSVAAGNKHSLAVAWNGSLYSWGRSADGQCGHGDVMRKSVPTLVRHLVESRVRVIAAAAGGYHSAVVTDAGDVFTFGSGARGRIGHGDEEDRRLPNRVQALARVFVTDVSCGYKHSMALTSDGHVYTWGKGKHGRLGHDDAANKFTPARISPDAFGGARIAGIAAGGHHSAAVTASGAVYTWGLNDNAQLGDSESSVPGAQRQNAYRPQLVTDLSNLNVRLIAAGTAHTLALTYEGEVWAWGLSTCGRLGVGQCDGPPQHGAAGEMVTRPTRVRFAPDADDVSTVPAHYDVRSDLPLMSEEDEEDSDEPGDPGSGSHSVGACPRRSADRASDTRCVASSPPPPASQRVVALSAGTSSHCLALTDDGRLWSWGKSEPLVLLYGLQAPASGGVPSRKETFYGVPARMADSATDDRPALRLAA